MTPVLALLPSPLLGPAVWQPVADALTARGRRAIAVAPPLVSPRSWEDILSALLSALPEDEDLVLVPHSNAGLYVPSLVAERRVAASVFVDALLPGGSGTVAVTSAAFLDVLRDKADADGLLPPWTAWWEEADVVGLFPDDAVRRRVEQEQQRLPLSYFEGSLPVQRGWDGGPGAYLAFGDTYAEDRSAAARRGWPVTTLPGRHLHMLVDPVRVADEVLRLTTAQGVDA